MDKNKATIAFKWQIVLGFVLVALSAFFYGVSYLLFHDSHHIWIFLIGDIAFVPIEVLLVTLIIHRMLSMREKRALLKKMNMVIGTFFNEAGSDLLKQLSTYDPEAEPLAKSLLPSQQWKPVNFDKTKKRIVSYGYKIDIQRGHLKELKTFLLNKRAFLLGLLENPNLLEHQSFTDLLWAVFHLLDELEHRDNLAKLPKSDLDHLAGDMRRVYSLIISEWLMYMKHLKTDYPYLFSLAVRTNPFDGNASVIIEE